MLAGTIDAAEIAEVNNRLENGAGFPGFRAAVREAVSSHAEKLLWSSDWPHTELFDAMPDDADLVDLAVEAIGAARSARVMARNAETLFFEH